MSFDETPSTSLVLVGGTEIFHFIEDQAQDQLIARDEHAVTGSFAATAVEDVVTPAPPNPSGFRWIVSARANRAQVSRPRRSTVSARHFTGTPEGRQ